MGKSNKFDYTNRPNSGAKLGQIIGGALQKEAEKVKKDAERLIQKARKQSTDSSSGTLETPNTTHIIDLKAPNKDLGDEGVCALVDGLQTALRSGTSQGSLALEDLNLCGNGVTTVSLVRLAPVIALAKYELKTLNLSDNTIKVENDQQAEQWESFLLAFKDCMRLRRLDLSGNSQLGTRAMEVLARIHISEPPISPISLGDASILSLIAEHDDSEQELFPQEVDDLDGSSLASYPAMSTPRVIKRRCGLRSIPYITLHHIGLDDVGALWLSYVLEDHHYPNQLIDELNATHSDSTIKTYQQDSNFCGVDWHENHTLGKEGLHLLEKTEALRSQIVLDDKAAQASSTIDDVDSVLGAGEHERRTSLDRSYFKVAPVNRRASVRSVRTSDGGEHEASELESARKKLKRYVIAHDGASSVELWQASLKFVRVSRSLLYISPVCRKYYVGPPLFRYSSDQTPHTDEKSIANGNGKLQITSTHAVTPPRSNVPQKSMSRKGASNGSANVDARMENMSIGEDSDGSAARYVRYQERRIAEASGRGREFRNTTTPSHLPKDVIEHIIGLSMTSRESSIMSNEQKKAALQWSQNRETLTTERDWLKKDESTQVLMLLDSIMCLAYGH